MVVKKIIKKIRKNFMSANEYAASIGVKMGKGCWLSTKDFPSEAYMVELGDYVRVAKGTSFYTHGGVWSLRHLFNDKNLDICGKIKVGSYSSIGANCMIMAGVTIGEKCIVAGGSVVTKSVPDGCMVAGNPAKFIGYTEDFYKRIKEKNDFGCNNLTREEKKDFLLSQPEDKFIKKGYIKMPDGKQ